MVTLLHKSRKNWPHFYAFKQEPNGQHDFCELLNRRTSFRIPVKCQYDFPLASCSYRPFKIPKGFLFYALFYTWGLKRDPFRAEPPRIVDHREYPPPPLWGQGHSANKNGQIGGGGGTAFLHINTLAQGLVGCGGGRDSSSYESLFRPGPPKRIPA